MDIWLNFYPMFEFKIYKKANKMKRVSNNVKISVPIDKSKNSTDDKAIESKMKQKELKVSLNEI